MFGLTLTSSSGSCAVHEHSFVGCSLNRAFNRVPCPEWLSADRSAHVQTPPAGVIPGTEAHRCHVHALDERVLPETLVAVPEFLRRHSGLEGRFEVLVDDLPAVLDCHTGIGELAVPVGVSSFSVQ